MEPWFEVKRLKIKNRERDREISGVGGTGRIFYGPTVCTLHGWSLHLRTFAAKWHTCPLKLSEVFLRTRIKDLTQEGLAFNMGSAEPKRSYSGEAETDGMGNQVLQRYYGHLEIKCFLGRATSCLKLPFWLIVAMSALKVCMSLPKVFFNPL